MNYKKIVCAALVMGACSVSAFAMAQELTSFQYFERGVLNQARANIEKAVEDYNRALELDATYAPSYYNRGICLIKLGDKEKAFADFNKAIEMNTKYVSAYINRGEYYLEKGDKEKALADFNTALLYAPQNKQALADKAKAEQ